MIEVIETLPSNCTIQLPSSSKTWTIHMIGFVDNKRHYVNKIQQNIRNELKELIAKDMVKIVDVSEDGTPLLQVTPKGIKAVEPPPEGPFQEIPGYGYICLN